MLWEQLQCCLQLVLAIETPALPAWGVLVITLHCDAGVI